MNHQDSRYSRDRYIWRWFFFSKTSNFLKQETTLVIDSIHEFRLARNQHGLWLMHFSKFFFLSKSDFSAVSKLKSLPVGQINSINLPGQIWAKQNFNWAKRLKLLSLENGLTESNEWRSSQSKWMIAITFQDVRYFFRTFPQLH